MPTDALPVARSERPAPPVRVRYRRSYRDLLDRPMTGKVRLAPTGAAEEGGVVIPAAPVDVDLADGVLDVQLPPGHYLVTAQLTTADGLNAVDRRDVTLTAD